MNVQFTLWNNVQEILRVLTLGDQRYKEGTLLFFIISVHTV